MSFKKKKSGTTFLLFGFIIFFIITIFESLISQYFISAPYFASSGLIFFILTEFAINKRFIDSEINLIKIEERQDALIKAMPDSLLLVKNDDTVEFHKVETDFKLIDFYGKNICDTLPEEILSAYREYKNIISVRSEDNRLFSKEIEIPGSNNFYEIRMIRAGLSHILINIRNITPRKKAEKESRITQERLIQADKLISLGTLVAGVAHEINNPNNSILLNAETLKEVWEKFFLLIENDPEYFEDMTIGSFDMTTLNKNVNESFFRMIHSSRRIKNIVEELKNFSRKDNDEYDEVIDVNQLIESSVTLIQNYINGKTENFSVDLERNIPDMRGNFQKMEQVIINIVQNACNSLPDKTRKVAVSAKYDEGRNNIIIVIEDEGCGMDEHVIRHIFDPFFTTRRDEGGSGLGLSVSAKIVEDHHGKIEIESIPGKGSRFKLIFHAHERN